MIDLYAIEVEIAALQAEGRARGLPRSMTWALDDFRTKFLPALKAARERQQS